MELAALVRIRCGIAAVTKGPHLRSRDDVPFPIKYRPHDGGRAVARDGDTNLLGALAGSTRDAHADLGVDELAVVEARRVYSDGLFSLPHGDLAGRNLPRVYGPAGVVVAVAGREGEAAVNRGEPRGVNGEVIARAAAQVHAAAEVDAAALRNPPLHGVGPRPVFKLFGA